jgi:hypothetical protein
LKCYYATCFSCLDQWFSTFFARGPLLSFIHFCGPHPTYCLIIINVIFIINKYLINCTFIYNMYYLFVIYGISVIKRGLLTTIFIYNRIFTHKGHMVAWLVEALCCKPEGHRFESWWGGFFSIFDPGVDSASDRNEYQESSWR